MLCRVDHHNYSSFARKTYLQNNDYLGQNAGGGGTVVLIPEDHVLEPMPVLFVCSSHKKCRK